MVKKRDSGRVKRKLHYIWKYIKETNYFKKEHGEILLLLGQQLRDGKEERTNNHEIKTTKMS